ncbi:MAG: DUF1772 domain-containing protein [Propionibacteriaceae bacterium]
MTFSAVLTALCALGSATVGGIFYAFSTFVLPGLGRLPPSGGVAAMQQVNVTAVRPGLMSVLFGTAALCLAAAIWALASGEARRNPALLIGALLYLVGGVGVTVAYNVPLNNALVALPADTSSAAGWADFLHRWAAGNHVRTITCLGAAVAFLVALREHWAGGND